MFEQKPLDKKPLVSYIRVSTEKQGRSGLGLGAQLEAVYRYAASVNLPIVKEFREVETSHKTTNRPVLAEAIAYAKQIGARLVVAKLDRLSRDVEFTAMLRNSGVQFVCADMPDANELTIYIIAAIAQHERDMISKRTKDALAYKKSQGFKLGSHNPKCKKFTREAGVLGGKATAKIERDAARKADKEVIAEILTLRHEGKTFEQIAEHLTAVGIFTRTGKAWNRGTVYRVLQRYKKERRRVASTEETISESQTIGAASAS